MQEIIVFLDIDGTLVDVEQRTNTEELPGLIAELRGYGVRFGLNSNRAIEDVIPIAKRFGLEGPFILENGAYIMETLDTTPIPTQTLIAHVSDLVEAVLRTCVARLYPDAVIERADTTDLISNRTFQMGKRFYMNRFRKFSASIHHRFDGEMRMDIAQTLAHELNRSFVELRHSLHAVAHAHGATVTVDVPGIDKGTGLAFLRLRVPHTMIIAIGDGSGDVTLRSYVDRLYAVANAIPELKAIADAVSSQPMTRGVVDLLKKYIRALL